MKKLSKSECGRLGGKKTAQHLRKKHTDFVSAYNTSPKMCPTCNEAIPFKKRYNNFCSHSCAATSTNSNRVIKFNPNWHRVTNSCLACGTEHKRRLFCNRRCQLAYDTTLFALGKLTTRKAIKRQLTALHGSLCSVCGLSEWRGSTLSLELDHIDGDAGNNMPSNLRLLCPNCHSITPTWKGKNKGNGRKIRGLPLH